MSCHVLDVGDEVGNELRPESDVSCLEARTDVPCTPEAADLLVVVDVVVCRHRILHLISCCHLYPTYAILPLLTCAPGPVWSCGRSAGPRTCRAATPGRAAGGDRQVLQAAGQGGWLQAHHRGNK